MWLAGKESTCNAGDLGSIPGFGRYSEKGKSYTLQYSGLKYSMDYTELDTTERLSLSNTTSNVCRPNHVFC